MNSVKRCCHFLKNVRALSLGLCGTALLGYSEFGVVDAQGGLGSEFDGPACDLLLIRVFAGAELALDQDRIALLRKLANLAGGRNSGREWATEARSVAHGLYQMPSHNRAFQQPSNRPRKQKSHP
jgi:hypothetical protein